MPTDSQKVKSIVLFVVLVLTAIGLLFYVGRNVFRSRAAVGPNGVEFSFSDNGTSVPVGTNFTTTISVTPKTTTNRISGYDLTLKAGGNLEFVDIDGPPGFTQITKSLSPTTVRTVFVNPTSDTTLLPSVALFHVVFKGNAVGTGSIQFQTTTPYQVVGTVSGAAFEMDMNPPVGNFTFTSGGGGGTTVTPTTSSGYSTPLSLKLKLQGVTKRPLVTNEVSVKISLVNEALGIHTAPQTVIFRSDASGIYTGTTTVDAPPGEGYVIYVKGSHHLQRKVCDPTPTETSFATYHCKEGKIKLESNANEFDFTGLPLLAGDIPPQDGVVDSTDVSYIREHLQSTTPSELTVGDLNFDGIIDTQDASLVFQALSVKFDEE